MSITREHEEMDGWPCREFRKPHGPHEGTTVVRDMPDGSARLAYIDCPGTDREEFWLLPKPPMGLIPRFVVEERRLRDIDAAIGRYVAHLMPIPPEWLDEREYLLLSLSLRAR